MSNQSPVVLTYRDKRYTDKDLMRIGNNMASIWGGSCIKYEVQESEVVFDCIEHGEFFITSCKFDELEEYND